MITDSLIDVCGRFVSVRDWGGDGPALILLPGGGCCVIDFALMAADLGNHYRVIAIEMRGHGLSDDAPWDWDGQIEDVRSVLKHLGIERPIIGGHSLGGMVAAMMGARDLCSAAINIDGHGQGKPDQYVGYTVEEVLAEQAEALAEREKLLSARAPLATAETIDQVRAAAIAQLVGFGFSETDAAERLSRATRVDDEGNVRARMTNETAIEIVDAVSELDLFAIYRDTKVPLLIYNATKQPASGPEKALAFHAAFRKGLARDLPALAAEHPLISEIEIDATHSLIYEQPTLIAGQILDFLVNVGL